MRRFEFAGTTAVVTGAASGIGRGTALALAARGCALALVDRDAAGLARVAHTISGVRVSTHTLDLADAAAVAALPAAVVAAHGGVAVLVNCAGVALAGTFSELTIDEFDWLFTINFHAPVALTKSFLPLLAQQPQAQIVNISSIFGIIAPATQTAYAAAKFALRGFSEALRHELAGSNISVTVVHPGGIATNIATGARIAAAADAAATRLALVEFNRSLVLSPELAGAQIVAAIHRRQPRLLVGRDAHLLAAIQRVLPVHYWAVLRVLYARALR